MRSLPACVVLALVLAGCAKQIDNSKAEKFISTSIAKQVGADVKAVSCPTGLTAKKGDTFQCTVTGADGTTGKTTVTEKDDQGNVSVSAPFIHVTQLEQSIGQGIAQQINANDVKVKCPEIITGKKGDTFECQATSGSDKATVEVTQKDDQGRVNYKVKQ